MVDVVLRASEEVQRQLEPLVAALRRSPGVAEVVLVERGFPAAARGLVLLFDREDVPALEALIGLPAAAGLPSELLPGRRGNATSLLPVREIRCFRAEGDTVTAELPAGAFEIQPRLYEVEAAYRARGFVRIAKSLIVNVVWVSEIVPWLGGRLLLEMKDAGLRLEVARSYVPDFKRFLGMGGNR